MSTKRRGNAATIALVTLISLTMVAALPFYTNGWASAVETEEMVDITQNDVYLEEGISDEEMDEMDLEEEDENISEDENQKKNKKKSDENSDEDSEDITLSATESDESDTDADVEEALEMNAVEDETDTDSEADVESDSDTDPSSDIDNEEYAIDEASADPEDQEVIEEAEVVEDDPEEENKEEEEKDDEDVPVDDQIIDGFPSTYQPLLQEMKAAHPNWTFVPIETGVSWKEAVKAEDHGSTSLVSPDAPAAQKNGSKSYDGRWKRASRDTIAYYMDPRNFLNEDEVFQFLTQEYDEESQNVDTVGSIISGSFMDGESPEGGYDNFQACIDDAGEEAGVNANVLAAMIIQEQGWSGSSLVSGEKDGYEGYYNFFNIGAWTTGSMSSTERGLWYAKGEGEDETSYGRPWDTPYKAILGGATFYYEKYISNNQNTYYTKKFNVRNGADQIGEHQYMTNVDGANDEGKLVRKAYENYPDMSATFEIPVFEDMPEETCQLPQ